MNVQKYSLTACGHLFAHYERAKDKDGNYIRFGNRQIDPSRSHRNINCAPDRGMSQMDYLNKRLSEVHHLKRADLNAMCSWVVSVPDDLPRDRYADFFYHSYTFLSARYGKENVISCYLHLDEDLKNGHPHIHFAFVPVIYDKKKERYKVSAKEVLNKKELSSIHQEMQNYLEREMGCPVHILNGKTKEGNRTIKELKEYGDRIKEQAACLQDLKDEGEALSKDLQMKLRALTAVEQEAERKAQELRTIEEKKQRITEAHADGIEVPDHKTKKQIGRREIVVLPREAWERFTGDATEMAGALGYANEKIKEADRMLKKVQAEREGREKDRLRILTLERENISLHAEVERWRERLDRFKSAILKAFPNFREGVEACLHRAYEEPKREREKERSR